MTDDLGELLRCAAGEHDPDVRRIRARFDAGARPEQPGQVAAQPTRIRPDSTRPDTRRPYPARQWTRPVLPAGLLVAVVVAVTVLVHSGAMASFLGGRDTRPPVGRDSSTVTGRPAQPAPMLTPGPTTTTAPPAMIGPAATSPPSSGPSTRGPSSSGSSTPGSSSSGSSSHPTTTTSASTAPVQPPSRQAPGTGSPRCSSGEVTGDWAVGSALEGPEHQDRRGAPPDAAVPERDERCLRPVVPHPRES
jgi:hypothetical protein